MAIHVALEHRTTYRYDRPVRLGPQVVRLRPAPHCRTPILSYALQVTPSDHFVNWQQDPFGNFLARFVFDEPTTELDVTVDLVADMTTINPFDFFVSESAERFPFTYEAGLRRDLAPYLDVDDTGPLLGDWLARARHDLELPPDAAGLRALGDGEATDARHRTIDLLVALNQRIQADIAYTVRMEPGVQAPEHTLDRSVGSCRDSGWLLVTVLRHLGLAARFASGYLVQLTADVASLDGPSGPDEDFTDLHAWAEVFVPGAGWVGLDPTSGLFAGEGHIPLACTPQPRSAAPIEGAIEPAGVTFFHHNAVRRIHEDPRVTLPYGDAQWREVVDLGRAVDERLVAGDVRLTMGGEPTFVSIDDMEAPEWNTEADGGRKRALAWDLTQRLFDRFARDGVVQHEQGKWYPDEPLPRWQLAVRWLDRHLLSGPQDSVRDGGPVDGVLWRDRSLLADPHEPGDVRERIDAGAVDDGDDLLARTVARPVAEGIARRLGLEAASPHLAYEDALHQLWQEAALPDGEPPDTDVDPADPSLADPMSREHAASRIDATAGRPVGAVVPLHHDGLGWRSKHWTLRRGTVRLTPGDSPIGLRLPLSSIRWGDAEPDDLGALCVEVRDDRLHVFLPPTDTLAAYRELLLAVEDEVASRGLQVVVEGYGPPSHPALRTISVAPDPGVIEVNIHPTSSWDELTSVVTDLYDDAHHARLGTESFDLDGTHTGTGGGNHLTLGGATPEDSPLLRRPELLRSMLTFWQQHPSLSYLFSGRFIGATSQAPRVDEGRDDRLHHLTIAFAELDRLTDEAASSGDVEIGAVASGDEESGDEDADGARPWIVDRILRNLLTDLTGNTHRSEFCIDKLYSPDGERGRLGLLELRGFEMPPHARMALVQALLVRSLVVRFWEDPHRGELVRWGTLLHDRFLLPWFVERDLDEVCADLREHGIAFDRRWLEPFLEFRFPRIGTTTVAGLEVELREGIEPWDVLGEEVTATGTARFVDSSMARLQVLVRNDTPGRHLLTVNGRALPLHPTGEAGTSVAGVRYRAWHPPSGLHPTIGVHAPLVLDVVDRWNGRSVGGCTYHVSHPGGRSYDTFPVNANEAASRRTSRFQTHGHTPGEVDLAALDRTIATTGPDHPRTLDLRMPSRR